MAIQRVIGYESSKGKILLMCGAPTGSSRTKVTMHSILFTDALCNATTSGLDYIGVQLSIGTGRLCGIAFSTSPRRRKDPGMPIHAPTL
jgi:hypothetical protein